MPKKPVVLIIDESQKMSVEQLTFLSTLMSLSDNDTPLIQIILFGQPELGNILHHAPKLESSFFDRLDLKPLNADEVSALIHYRLEKAGYLAETPLFSKTCIETILKLTRGYPRKVCLLAHHILKQMVVSNQKTATENTVISTYYEKMHLS